MKLDLFMSPYRADLKKVQHVLSSSFKNVMKQDHYQYMTYVLDNNGKQFRPFISILIASSYQKIDTYSYDLFAAIEMVHIASLLHDDVIDDADLRRGKQTVCKKWGNSMSVVLGVYAYSNSLSLLHRSGDMYLIGYFSKIVNRMCEGELYQLDSRISTKMNFFSYLRVVYCKTACLFSAAFFMGSYVCKISSTQKKMIKQIGLKFGFLYQFIDDILDFTDTNNQLNKLPFQDLKNGQLTLPLILYYRKANQQAISFSKLQGLTQNQVIDEFKKYHIFEESKNIIKHFECLTEQLCDCIENNKLKSRLKIALKLILQRL